MVPKALTMIILRFESSFYRFRCLPNFCQLRLLDKFGKCKYIITFMFIFTLGRMASGDFLGGLNEMFAAFFGMFLLKDESYFVPCVEFILETPFGACANIGGAICLWPFIMLCTINASFDFLQLLQFWNDPSLWDPNISPDARSTLGVSRNLVLGLVPWLVGSCLSQFWAANICWRIYRELRLTGYGDIMGDGPGGNFLGGG